MLTRLSQENIHEGNVVWVIRSFLDYRVPVFIELDELLDGRLYILYSSEHTPERCWVKLEKLLGKRAIGFAGEKSIGYQGNITEEMANSKLRVPYQPGLLKKIKELQPAVLISDGFFQWTWSALVYRLFKGTPLVVCYERTLHTERHAQWYRTLFRKIMIRFISAMSVNGRLSKEYIEFLGMTPERITTGHMVADTNSLFNRIKGLKVDEINQLRDHCNIQEDVKVFLSVSQLIRRKGIKELLWGWKRFKTGNNNSILLLVGDGPERNKLKKICRDQMIEGVIFAGAIVYEEIYKYFALSDVFVMPTLEDNWSLVVPEAMACGKPILCSIYNGCWPELVMEGINGWVFDPKDSEDIANVFKKCLDSDLVEMGKKSRGIISNHTPKQAAEAIFKACILAKCTKVEK